MAETFEQTGAVVPEQGEPTEAQPEPQSEQPGTATSVDAVEADVQASGDENGAVPEPAAEPQQPPQQITEAMLRKLRAKYFTVRHQRLEGCGHKFDEINEPRHSNCENCWFQWFNTHPQLVEVTDQFYRTHGAKALEGMRGTKYVKNFRRYMATVIHFMKEEGRLNESNSEGRVGSTLVPSEEGGVNSTVDAPVEGGETEDGGITEQVAEHILQVCAPSEAGQEEAERPTIHLD